MSFEVTNPKVRRSILSAQEFSGFLEENYNLKDVSSSLLHCGFNDSYNITTKNKEYILRIYYYDWRTSKEIMSELDFILFLNDENVPVGSPVHSKTNELIFKVSSPEGVRYGVLFEKCSGKWVMDYDHNQCKSLGKILAKIHTVSREYKKTINRQKLDLSYLIDEPFRLLRKRFPSFLNEISKLETYFETVKHKVISTQSLSVGFIHGDYLTNNFCEDKNNEWSIFDFDLCGEGFHIYDLATYKWSLGFTNNDDKASLFESFLNSYKENIKFDVGIIDELINDFVYVRQLWVWSIQIKEPESFTALSDVAFKYWYDYFEEKIKN